jgi:hypothetical protein
VRPPRLPLIGEELASVLSTIENAIAIHPNLKKYHILLNA